MTPRRLVLLQSLPLLSKPPRPLPTLTPQRKRRRYDVQELDACVSNKPNASRWDCPPCRAFNLVVQLSGFRFPFVNAIRVVIVDECVHPIAQS